MTWHITSRLPDEEPNEANFAAYSQPQLMAGASPDARYLFDAVYDAAPEIQSQIAR